MYLGYFLNLSELTLNKTHVEEMVLTFFSPNSRLGNSGQSSPTQHRKDRQRRKDRQHRKDRQLKILGNEQHLEQFLF